MRYSKLFGLAAIILALNIVWEFSHHSLYIDLSGIPSTQHLFMASGTDLIIIAVVFAANSLSRKSLKWIERPKARDNTIITILCLAIAIVIESRALSIGRWAYTDAMPTIFGIGLSPLLQLAVTSLIALFVYKN